MCAVEVAALMLFFHSRLSLKEKEICFTTVSTLRCRLNLTEEVSQSEKRDKLGHRIEWQRGLIMNMREINLEVEESLTMFTKNGTK